MWCYSFCTWICPFISCPAYWCWDIWHWSWLATGRYGQFTISWCLFWTWVFWLLCWAPLKNFGSRGSGVNFEPSNHDYHGPSQEIVCTVSESFLTWGSDVYSDGENCPARRMQSLYDQNYWSAKRATIL
jgi:hypothetical protein